MSNAIDQVLGDGVRVGAVPGVVATVVDRGGVVYEGGFGERAAGSGVEMTPETVGAIFSMTKAVTGAAAMQLVEQGQLDLDADAGEICKELANPVVLEGFDADGAPITRPAASPVTLRHLLTHTSGFVYDIWNAEMGRWYEATSTPSLFSLERRAFATPLAFDPGTSWAYGIGIDWVGLMIEEVAGQTLGDYFRDHLTGPLGMRDTAFAHTDSMLDRAAAIHARLPDGSLAPIELPGPENPEFEMGGGGLQSTMGDYGRFMRMILGGGELDGVRVLQQSTVDQMVENHIGSLRVAELATAMPEFSNDAEMYPGEEKSWGLTFQIHEEPSATGAPTGTLSWAGLANSYFWIDRANDVAGCYLSQILPFADPQSIELFYAFQRTVYADR